jgi:hypothetical protein
MLTRALFLAAIWFVISFAGLIVFGIQVKRRNWLLSFFWLAAVILVGDAYALVSFGKIQEVALFSQVIFIVGAAWIVMGRDWNAPAQVAWLMMNAATALYLAYTFSLTLFAPTNAIGYILAVFFFFIELAALALSLSYAYEALDVICRVKWRRARGPLKPAPGYAPKVSLHVPAYNEPVEIVESTLKSIAKMEYDDYEVLVIDNNTPDEKSWRPLVDICHKLGVRFRCLHLDQWPGYKSGALNFALAQTAPDAEIIGIIDADYQVNPYFLQDTVSAFADNKVRSYRRRRTIATTSAILFEAA